MSNGTFAPTPPITAALGIICIDVLFSIPIIINSDGLFDNTVYDIIIYWSPRACTGKTKVASEEAFL